MATFLRFLLCWITVSASVGNMIAQTAPKAERLLGEKSPYLQRHADNLVDWYPWGDATVRSAVIPGDIVSVTVGPSSR